MGSPGHRGVLGTSHLRLIALPVVRSTEPVMRRHDPQQQPRSTMVGTYSSPESPHAGDPNIGWVIDFLSSHLDARGRAVVACARLVVRRHRVEMRSALGVARDVLAGESLEHCEALAVLLGGEWDGSLGDALHAARRI